MTELEIFKQNLDVSRITLLITSIMAVTTIVFSALTMAFQRSHNKRSVRPFCNVRKITAQKNVVILVKNSGLGPMTNCSISITDQNGTPADPGCTAVLNKIRDYTFMANEEIEILSYEKGSQPEAAAETYVLRIEYTDIYDNTYSRKIQVSDL